MGGVRPYGTLRFTKDASIATIELDRPRMLNAYNVAMRDDLFAVLGAVDDDPEVRVVVLRGRGRAFSTGGDVSEFGAAPSPVAARAVRWRRDVWARLLDVRAATIAAVHGWAAGGGFEMALLCDLVVAAAGTRFRLPETALGMIPGVGATQTLPRRVGVGRALDLVLTGRTIGAREALALGLVNVVVPRARLVATAGTIAGRLAALAPDHVLAVRRLVRAAHDGPLALGARLERIVGDGLEGMR